MIKASINQKDISIVNIYGPNNRASKYTKQTDRSVKRNRQIHDIVRDFNTNLSIIDRTSRQKVRKNKEV